VLGFNSPPGLLGSFLNVSTKLEIFFIKTSGSTWMSLYKFIRCTFKSLAIIFPLTLPLESTASKTLPPPRNGS